jgi:hypothetical protein
MNNFKYLSTKELEDLIDNLKIEIASLEKCDNMKPQLELDKEMLRDAEFEVIERTLLS